jgi:valyl-tRNA synthetase
MDADKTVMLPLMDRAIPVIRDSYVDMSFGTGGLKVTPAHDPNDFEIGVRHDLPSVIKAIGDDGRMTAAAGVRRLGSLCLPQGGGGGAQRRGCSLGSNPSDTASGHCYRCKDRRGAESFPAMVFVKTGLAQKAIAAVKDGQTRIVPENWTATYSSG